MLSMKKLILIASLIIFPTSGKWLQAQEWHDVTITVYNPTASQCDSTPLITACNKKIDLSQLKAGQLRWIAVSRDLLAKYPYGTSMYLWIAEGHPKNGTYIVRDTMNKRYTNTIDILTYNETRGKWHGKIQKNP